MWLLPYKNLEIGKFARLRIASAIKQTAKLDYFSVKLLVSVMGGDVSLKLPFTLMHTCNDYDGETLTRVKRVESESRRLVHPAHIHRKTQQDIKQEKDGTWEKEKVVFQFSVFGKYTTTPALGCSWNQQNRPKIANRLNLHRAWSYPCTSTAFDAAFLQKWRRPEEGSRRTTRPQTREAAKSGWNCYIEQIRFGNWKVAHGF